MVKIMGVVTIKCVKSQQASKKFEKQAIALGREGSPPRVKRVLNLVADEGFSST